MAEQPASFPMISERNWWAIRDKFKAALPTTVTPNYIKTLLSLSSDASASSNVILPMKRIGLLDSDGKPTPLANDWRLDHKYKEVCDTIVKDVYDGELLDLFPDQEVDRSTAKNWFMGRGVGEGAADKMVALFILLKSGEIKDRKTNPTKKQVTPSAKSGNKPKVTPPESGVDSPKGKDSSTERTSKPNLHIDLQIHISPESTPDQIEAIFASMAKHLYGADHL